MKKFLVLLTICLLGVMNVANAQVVSNEQIDKAKVKVATKIITGLQKEMTKKRL